MHIISIFFHFIISLLPISFNSPAAEVTLPVSNANATTTSPPSPPKNDISPTQSDGLPFDPSPDLESGNQPSPIPIPDNTDTDLPEWKRIGNVVQTVSFGGFAASITLFVSKPDSATTHPALYIAYLTFVCLGLATSMCLSVYSISKKGNPAVGLVQKKLICFTSFFVVLSCLIRLRIELPPIALGFVMVPALIGMLYLFVCSRCQPQTHETDTI